MGKTVLHVGFSDFGERVGSTLRRSAIKANEHRSGDRPPWSGPITLSLDPLVWASMERPVEDFGSSIETYGRAGDRKLLGVVGMVSSLAVAIGLYAAVGFAQTAAIGNEQVRNAYPLGSMAASLESADGPGGAASLARSRTAASVHGEG